MVGNTRSGRDRNVKGHKNEKIPEKDKGISGSQNVNLVTPSSPMIRASSSKGRNGKGTETCGSSTSDTSNTLNFNKRRSSRIERLALPVSPTEKKSQQQEKATPISLRRSGRIESAGSTLKTPQDVTKKNQKGKIFERTTPVGKGDAKQNVKCDNLYRKKMKTLNAAAYRASFMPSEKKGKSSDISQGLEKDGDSSQIAGVNSSSDGKEDGGFAKDSSTGNSISVPVNKSRKIVESDAGHKKERADRDLQEQEFSSCKTIVQSISNNSTSKDNVEGDSKQVGGAQWQNFGNQRYEATERCIPDSSVVPLSNDEGYNADLTSEQDIEASREQPLQKIGSPGEQSNSQGEITTGRHSSDGLDDPLTNAEEYVAACTLVQEREAKGEKSNIMLVNESVIKNPDIANGPPSKTVEKDHAYVSLELEGSFMGNRLKTQREKQNADAVDSYNEVALLSTKKDRRADKTGGNVCFEDLMEGSADIGKLRSNVQTEVARDAHDICKQAETPLCCCIDRKLSNLSPEKACPGTWHSICLGEKLESETCSVSKGIKSVSDTQETKINKCSGEKNRDPVNYVKVSSLPSPNITASKEQFGRCSNEFKADSSTKFFLEFWVPVQLSKIQLEQYCSILISGSAILRTCSKDQIGASSDILVSTRKCCDHPYLVDSSLQGSLTKDLPPAEYLDVGVHASGKLMLLDKILQLMKQKGLRAVILFHQFIGGDVKMSIGDILDDFLRQRFGADSYERVDSGLVMAKKQNAMQMFNKKETGRFVFLIENRACLPSIKLSAVNAVIIFGSDWNPLGDLKALHRINIDSELNQLNIFRFYSLHTLEEKILSFAREDVILESNIPCISRKRHSLLSSGAHYLFDELDKFHKDDSPSGCLKTLHHSSLLDDTVSEILTQLSNISGNTTSSSIITKAQQVGTAYSRSISLFGVKDIGTIDEELPQAFWSKLLDGRHPRWRYITGQSQRHRRKVQQLEEPPHPVRDENNDAKRKRRKISLSTMDSVSWQPSIHGKKEDSSSGIGGSNQGIHGAERLQTDHGSKESEVPRPANGCGKLRTSQQNLHLLLAPEILKLCDILQLPDDVKIVAESFLDYIMNNHHVSQEPETLLQAFKLSLCWRAASFLKYRIDHTASLAHVKKELRYECSENEAESVYTKLQMLKKKFSLPVTALLKCVESNNLENLSSNQLQDKNKKNISPVVLGLIGRKQHIEKGEVREVHKLPEHLLERQDQVGQLLVNTINFDQDKIPKNMGNLLPEQENISSSQVEGNIQEVPQSQYQQRQILSPGNLSCDNTSVTSHQVHAVEQSGSGFSVGDERSEQGKIPSPLLQEQFSSPLLVNSSESCLPSVEVERPAASVFDEMGNEQVNVHRSGAVAITLQSANAEVNVENVECVAERLEHRQLPSSHIHVTLSIEPIDNVPSVVLERLNMHDTVCTGQSLTPALPNMASTFQLNDAPSLGLERFMASDGIVNGQLSCSSQQMEAPPIQLTDAMQPVRLITSNAENQHAPVNSLLNIVSVSDVSPSIEQNAFQRSHIPPLQPNSSEQLEDLHAPVHMQFSSSPAQTSTEHENDRDVCSEMACTATTSATGIFMQRESVSNTQQDALPKQLFPQALEHQEHPMDLQEQRTDTLSGTQILQEDDNNCLIDPFVINTRLSVQELLSDPLQNEMLRIRKEINTVSQEFENKKIQMTSEYESEQEKLTRKYETLFEEAESAYLEKERTLEMIFHKVFMNSVLANEFRSRFSDKVAAATAVKPLNLQGGSQGFMPQLHGSQPQFGQSVVPASSMMTTLMTAPNVALTRPTACPPLLSGQAHDTMSTSVSLDSVLPVPVVLNSSGLSSSSLSRPHIGSMLPSIGNIQGASGLHRSPAPHLNSYRPLVSGLSPTLSTESCGLIQQHPTSGSALPRMAIFPNVPVMTRILSSCDSVSGSHILSGDHFSPAVPTCLQVPDVQELPSEDTSCRTNEIPRTCAVPAIPTSLQIPAAVQHPPSKDIEHHPGNVSVANISGPVEVLTITESLPSKDSCSIDKQHPGNDAAHKMPLIIHGSNMSASLTSVEDSRTESTEGFHLLQTTLCKSASCEVDVAMDIDKHESVDPPEENSKPNRTPCSILPDTESGVTVEVHPAMATEERAVLSEVI